MIGAARISHQRSHTGGAGEMPASPSFATSCPAWPSPAPLRRSSSPPSRGSCARFGARRARVPVRIRNQAGAGLLEQVRLRVLRRCGHPVVCPGFGYSQERLGGWCGRIAATPVAVADVVDEAARVELVEELAVGVLVKIAAIAKCGHRPPVSVFVRDVP